MYSFRSNRKKATGSRKHFLKNRLMHNKGFILITILLFFVLLVSIVAVYLFLSTTEVRQAGNNIDYAKALALAEAGIERGIRQIRDDVLAPIQTNDSNSLGYHANPNIDATDYTNSPEVAKPDGVLKYDDGKHASLKVNQFVRVRNFLELTNLRGTRLKSVELGCRYQLNKSANSGTIDLHYTRDNWSTPNFVGTLNVSSKNWEITYFNLPNPPISDWVDLNTSAFGIQASATSVNGPKKARLEIDYLFIRPIYEIDASSEPWFAGFNNIVLGDGEIESVKLIDESGKVHLNYATALLLNYLMQECTIPAAEAATIADNVITYRAGKWFDTIEELKVVSGITQDYYNLIKDYITVYSFVNNAVSRPSGARAPVNINSAPQEVLEAIFDPLDLRDVATLAADIIAQREILPFAYVSSSYSLANATGLEDFVDNRDYLSGGERKRVLENADASSRDWGSDLSGGKCATTEFSYYSNSFLIDAVGIRNNVSRRLNLVIKDDGNKYLDTFLGDVDLKKYWREAP